MNIKFVPQDGDALTTAVTYFGTSVPNQVTVVADDPQAQTAAKHLIANGEFQETEEGPDNEQALAAWAQAVAEANGVESEAADAPKRHRKAKKDGE